MKRRRPAAPPRPRADGSRRSRRALRRGGEGLAERLNEVVAGWEGVHITPMFGRWGYFVRDQLFGCYPIRAKEHDLWVRLSRADQARALATTGVRPHRRFGAAGWIECDVADAGELSRAVRWLRHGWSHVRRVAGSGPDAGLAGGGPAPGDRSAEAPPGGRPAAGEGP